MSLQALLLHVIHHRNERNIMAFYIKPPRGHMQLARVDSITWCRLKFLVNVSRCGHSVVSMKDLVRQASTVAESDCLIEGSQKDIASHFLLRLACVQDSEMEKFFLSSETRLFMYRFSCMTMEELTNCVKPLRRLLRMSRDEQDLCRSYNEIIQICNSLTKNFDWNMLLKHFVSSDSERFVHVPFMHVLDLIRKRTVHLDRGIAKVPCSKLCNIMTEIFRIILRQGLVLAKLVLPSIMESDNRIARLLKQIKAYFYRSYFPQHGWCVNMTEPVQFEDVDNLVAIYPPCMGHLHKQLRQKHRLRHFSRIQYTLFLKELGLPVHEALQFWRSEYIKPSSQATGQNSGSRNWQTEGRRYTYSIRHLYGLEGARINYRGHCCSSIQNQNLSPGEEGGCPFKDFDRQHLIEEFALGELHLDSVRQILTLSKENLYNEACQVYLQSKLDVLRSQTEISHGKLKESVHDKMSIQHRHSDSGSVGTHSNDGMAAQKTDACVKSEIVEIALHNQSEELGESKKFRTNIEHSIKKYDDFEMNFKYDDEMSEQFHVHKPRIQLFSSQMEANLNSPRMTKISQNPLISDLNLTQGQSGQLRSGGSVLSTDVATCFNHDVCPDSQLTTPKNLKDSLYGTNIILRKPIDYVHTYRALLDGIK